MLSHSEARQYSTAKRKFPIPGATINTATYNPIEATRLRLVQVQNAIFMAEQEQARNRRGKRGAEIDRKKRALSEELDLLTQTFAILTAIPKEEKKTNPIVHVEPKRKTLVDYLPISLFRSLSMAGFALTLLTPGTVLAEGGPTPEPTHPVKVSDRYTLNMGRVGNRVTLWTKSNGSNAKLLALPPLNVGNIQSAIAGKYGDMVNSAGCADQIVDTNVSNVETMNAAQARLKKQTGIYSSDRLITVEGARMIVDLINACALKADKIIQTVFPSVTPLPPSKIPSTTLPTKAQPSPTPIQPTSTSTPQAEVPSSTDTEKNIKYILGGAFVLALLGLGSLTALVIRNGNKRKDQDPPEEPAIRDPELIRAFVTPVHIVQTSTDGTDGVRVDVKVVHVVPGYDKIPYAEGELNRIMREEMKRTSSLVGGVPPQDRAHTIEHEKRHMKPYLDDTNNVQGVKLGTWVSAHPTEKGAVVAYGAATYPEGKPSREAQIQSLKAVKDLKPSSTDRQQLKDLGESYGDESPEPKK